MDYKLYINYNQSEKTIEKNSISFLVNKIISVHNSYKRETFEK